MWYWVHKAEGLSALPFVVLYYTVRRVPFSLRCKECRGWLTERQYMRSGLCRACHERMAVCGSNEYYSEKYYVRPEENLEPPAVKPAHEPIFSRVAERIGQGKILDVGCGIGYLLSAVSRGRRTYGMDMSPDALKLAMRWTGGEGFCLADAQCIPYMSDSFDYVVCMEVLEHIEEDKAARECLRVLKPGGIALITVPNGKGIYGKSHPSHIRVFTFHSIQDYLRQAGFEIIGAQKFGLHIPFVTSYSSVLSCILRRNLPLSTILNVRVPEFLSADFLIECRKPVG